MRIHSALILAHVALSFNTKFFAPQGTFQVVDKTEPVQGLSDEQVAAKTLIDRLHITKDEFEFTAINHAKNGVTYFYAHRIIDGVRVSNEVANVVVKNGVVLSVSDTFSKKKPGPQVRTRELTLSLKEAVKIAEDAIGAPRDDYPATKVYITDKENNRVFCHQFQLKDIDKDIFCRVSVDMVTGAIVQVIDFGSAFSITAVKFQDLDAGNGFSLLKNEADPLASPNGWNTIDGQTFTTTKGNNVRTENNGATFDAGPDLNFETFFDPNANTKDPRNINSSLVNTFYTLNKLHDIFYHFGFTESAGNFQQSNFGKGGKDNDSVIVYNHYQNERNNARFYTPSDGQPGEMRMFEYNFTNPMRDSGNDQTIVIHEFGHGVSNRLTGGPSTASCLQDLEAKGLGEGWSDIFAFMLTRKGTETANDHFAIGSYVTGKPQGLRKYPFSRDFKINPWTYKDIKKLSDVHDFGTIFGNILFDIYWTLVEKYGHSTNWYDSTQPQGNIVMMNIIIAGLKSQLCNPGFADARDGMLMGDEQMYGGKHKCLIWTAFAKRGVGVGAGASVGMIVFLVTESFKVPPECLIYSVRH